MFGLTTTAKLRAVTDALIQMQAQRDNARSARDAAAERASKAERLIAGLREDVRTAEAAYEKERGESLKKGRLASELLTERDAARDKLREVIAAETQGCAPIGRKMARIARAGLPEFAVPADAAEAA